jgi:hypothetical protein
MRRARAIASAWCVVGAWSALACAERVVVEDDVPLEDPDEPPADDPPPPPPDDPPPAVDPDDCDAPFEPVASPRRHPLYSGTAYVTDDLITADDPSAFVDLTYAGVGERRMYDRRTSRFDTLRPHLFDARFGARTRVEIQVNPEFDRAQAEAHARTYATELGRIPGFLFADIDTMWIHDGDEDLGGGNRNILIHTTRAASHLSRGELEEVLVHEGVHTSLDAALARDPRWLEAAAADGVSISTYGRDNPLREDLSETVGPFLAVTFRRGRISPAQTGLIEATIPNRLKFLRCQGWSMALAP